MLNAKVKLNQARPDDEKMMGFFILVRNLVHVLMRQ